MKAAFEEGFTADDAAARLLQLAGLLSDVDPTVLPMVLQAKVIEPPPAPPASHGRHPRPSPRPFAPQVIKLLRELDPFFKPPMRISERDAAVGQWVARKCSLGETTEWARRRAELAAQQAIGRDPVRSRELEEDGGAGGAGEPGGSGGGGGDAGPERAEPGVAAGGDGEAAGGGRGGGEGEGGGGESGADGAPAPTEPAPDAPGVAAGGGDGEAGGGDGAGGAGEGGSRGTEAEQSRPPAGDEST